MVPTSLFGHPTKLAGQGWVLDETTMPTDDHPQKITFGEMRASGVRDVLVYCRDHRCSHHIAISADFWPDHVRLSDIEDRFVCRICGKRGCRSAAGVFAGANGDRLKGLSRDLTLQLPTCFEMRTLNGGLVRSAPE